MPTLGEQVDDIQERMWKLPTASGGYATIELWGPIAVTRDSPGTPCGIAERVYGTGRVTSVTGRTVAEWREAVRRHIKAHTTGDRAALAKAEYLADALIAAVTDSLGDLRSAATVAFTPSQWYAAIWEDWLLVTGSRAAVLHLGWDS